MRLTLAVALGAASVGAACGRGVDRAQAGVPDVAGHYVSSAAGTTASVPWALRVDLSLEADSTYELALGLRLKDEDSRETDRGTYRVANDRLRLVSSGESHEGHELHVRGDSLALSTDWVGAVALRLAGLPRPVLVRER
jgi:hypothetical protein